MKYKEIAEIENVNMRKISHILKQHDLIWKIDKKEIAERQEANEEDDSIDNVNCTEIIEEMLKGTKKVDLKYLKNLIEINYERIKMDDLKNALKIYTRQGETKNAIYLINSLTGLEENEDKKQKLGKLKTILEQHQIKVTVYKRLKQGVNISEIAEEVKISEAEVKQLKKQLEDKNVKKQEQDSR